MEHSGVPDNGTQDARGSVVLEVVERPTVRGCSAADRRTFRNRTIPRLLEEFSPTLEVVWKEPPADTCTAPTIFLAGELLHAGGYMPWEILRPAVGWALALQQGLDDLTHEAEVSLANLGIEAVDWQDGLLAWLRRQES